MTIIYNKVTGETIFTTNSDVGEVASTVADVPVGKYIDSVNPVTGEVILKDIPKSPEQQKIEELEARLADNEAATLGLMDMVGQ